MHPITTNILRSSYEQNVFSFGNPSASKRLCIIGSCRVVPLLNALRVYNEMTGNPLELLCFNPVEMWGGPGTDVGDCANALLKDYHMGKVDFLISEHLENCGVLNTVKESERNVFDSLGCEAGEHLRLPNWNNMHLFDVETAMWDSSYGALEGEERVTELRARSGINKQRFVDYCRKCSFPEITDWIVYEWFTTRFGWTSNHPTHALYWRIITLVFEAIGIEMTPQISGHPLCAIDIYQSTGIPLNEIDRAANGWRF